MGAKILIVEDEETVLTLLSNLFSFFKEYEIILARDGEEALNVIMDNTPDIVLLDIQLPKINGYELCEAIKSNPATADIKVLMLTGLAQDYNLQEALRAGANACMTKPFSAKAIVEKVAELLSSN